MEVERKKFSFQKKLCKVLPFYPVHQQKEKENSARGAGTSKERFSYIIYVVYSRFCALSQAYVQYEALRIQIPDYAAFMSAHTLKLRKQSSKCFDHNARQTAFTIKCNGPKANVHMRSFSVNLFCQLRDVF